MTGSLVVLALVFWLNFTSAATQKDLLLYNLSLLNGTANGFVGKGTHKNGADVWLEIAARYGQDCQKTVGNKDHKTKVVRMTKNTSIDISKEVNYADRLNPKKKLSGYLWNVQFDSASITPSSRDVCPPPFSPVGGLVMESQVMRVYLSKDKGMTTMLDSVTGLPIEISIK